MSSAYLVTASVEIVFLMVLATLQVCFFHPDCLPGFPCHHIKPFSNCFQVGVLASFAGLVPMLIYLPSSLIVANLAGKHQSIVHGLKVQRMDIVNDGIAFNPVIKLLKAEALMEASMADFRSQEEKHTRWFSVSSALTLSMQLSVATLMVRISI